MKVIIAYIIAVLCAPVAGMFPGFIVALLFSWVPDRVGVPLRTLLGGCTETTFAVGFGFLVFRWIVGVGSFGVLPYLGAVLIMSVWAIENYAQYQRAKQMTHNASDNVRRVLTPEILGMGTQALGQVVGILVGGYLFIEWSR